MVSTARWIAALLALCCAPAAAQMYKCKDAKGKITYAGDECGKLGLRSAGEVKGRASVAPAYRPPPSPAAARPKPAAAAQGAPAAADAAKDAERRCFTVKTAKGTATRCNDVPDETKK